MSQEAVALPILTDALLFSWAHIVHITLFWKTYLSGSITHCRLSHAVRNRWEHITFQGPLCALLMAECNRSLFKLRLKDFPWQCHHHGWIGLPCWQWLRWGTKAALFSSTLGKILSSIYLPSIWEKAYLQSCNESISNRKCNNVGIKWNTEDNISYVLTATT